ncbi:hypothetical protein GGI04_002035 [Coemansia thaxteri]|nr:hypothetical protein GGI04_002035 [Coemansia thaxteri]KAJ2472080.1 hypothetical protein GGI02_001829 [Coemansia sp. RSA 2322]
MHPAPIQQEHKSAAGEYRVGLVMARRLWRVFGVLLDSRIGLACASLLVAKLLAEVVFYYAGRLPSEFYHVLGDRLTAAFFPLLLRCVVVVAGAGAAKAGLDYAAGMLGVMMRSVLTAYTHRRFIAAPCLYATVTAGAVDNPDQRITQDIERLATSLATALPELLIAPFLIAYYSVKCWAISGPLGPLAIYAYFAAGAMASRAFMPPVIRAVFCLEREEGNLRFLELRLAQLAEPIAFFAGEGRERAAADDALGRVLDVLRRLLRSQLWLGLVTQIFAYLGSTVSYVIIAVPIFMGAYDGKSGSELSSIISLNAFVSMYLIYRFSVVIDHAKKLSDIAGYSARIVQLWEEIDRVERDEDEDEDQDHQLAQDSTIDPSRITAADATVCTPTGHRLVAGLTVDVSAGRSLLITGPNGTGKTSVLRTLCGLWRPAAGCVRVPRSEVFFLPQTAYVVAGSLREQLSYPGLWGTAVRVCDDAELARLLAAVGLASLVGRIAAASASASADHSAYDRPFPLQFWLQVLSPGEQQKISIARVLFWKPRFAVLDECTSALDPAAEAAVYQALLDARVTLVSVSHHESLRRYHAQCLDLGPLGSYTLTDI